MARLDELQEAANDDREEHSGPNEEPTSKSMYFLGKDVAFADAKSILRERVEIEEEVSEK